MEVQFVHKASEVRGFPGGTVKNPSANAEDSGDAVGLIPGTGRCPGVGNGNPLLCSCLNTHTHILTKLA